VVQSRGILRSGGKGGFTYPEMAFLLAVIALFLVGTVWVVNGAIVKSHPPGKSDRAGSEAERALDRIESMVRAARQFYYTGRLTAEMRWGPAADCLDLLADLDGDPNTGSFEASSQGRVEKGLERVVIFSRGAALVAQVYSGPGAVPRTVVLLNDRSPGDDRPFKASFRIEEQKAPKSAAPGSVVAENTVVARTALDATAVRVSITTGLGGSRLVIGRTIGLPARPPLAPTLPPGL
jgi:hypothetical protein